MGLSIPVRSGQILAGFPIVLGGQADRGFAAQVAGQSCCLGLLGLLCCDHDDRVFPYNGYGNSVSIYVRNPSASLK